jgi:DNA-binding response OmpR family regulator
MSLEKLKILLVEDDQSLGFVVQDILKNEGYMVHLATDGAEGLQKFSSQSYDICLLDVMLPKKDGFSLAKDIRKLNENVPIIFITAKGMNQDKVEGFKSGADDYITKPFSQEEMLLRVKAILKRSGKQSEDKNKKQFELGKYTFDAENYLLNGPEGERQLTKKESELLRILCEHQGKVVERELAATLVWGESSYFVGRSMDVFITRLRKYLKDDAAVIISNIHGVGFRLDA